MSPLRLVKRSAARLLNRHLWKLQTVFLERNLAHSILHKEFGAVLATPRIPRREAVWDHVAAAVGPDSRVLYLEFGVFEGYSIRYFAERLRNPQSRFIGFDSFEGLPEVWGRKQVGTFSTQGSVPAIDDARVSFVKGWFHDTVPGFAVPGRFDRVLVHMDADLFSSTLFVLAQLWHKFAAIDVVFDEFMGDECRALYSFAKAFPCDVAFLAHDDALPRRVYCRIERRPMAVTPPAVLPVAAQ